MPLCAVAQNAWICVQIWDAQDEATSPSHPAEIALGWNAHRPPNAASADKVLAASMRRLVERMIAESEEMKVMQVALMRAMDRMIRTLPDGGIDLYDMDQTAGTCSLDYNFRWITRPHRILSLS
jgi:hypothetical protein